MYRTVRYDTVKIVMPMTMQWGMETARNVAVIDLGMSFIMGINFVWDCY